MALDYSSVFENETKVRSFDGCIHLQSALKKINKKICEIKEKRGCDSLMLD